VHSLGNQVCYLDLATAVRFHLKADWSALSIRRARTVRLGAFLRVLAPGPGTAGLVCASGLGGPSGAASSPVEWY
jgi:hypothetical protein